MKTSANVALAQIDIEALNPQANLKKIESTVARIVAEKPVDLVVFPALASVGYPVDAKKEAYLAAARQGGDAFLGGMTEIAKLRKVHLVGGLLEVDAKNHAFNSVVLISPEGEIIGRQRQVHLITDEDNLFGVGDEISVFPSSLGNIALVVGNDMQSPEFSRVQTLKGAEITCCLVNKEKDVENPGEWLLLMAICRAMENKVYFFMCNRIGQQGDKVFAGASCLIEPGGGIMAQLSGEAEEIARGSLSADVFIEERFKKPAFRDRRPENYGVICQR